MLNLNNSLQNALDLSQNNPALEQTAVLFPPLLGSEIITSPHRVVR